MLTEPLQWSWAAKCSRAMCLHNHDQPQHWRSHFTDRLRGWGLPRSQPPPAATPRLADHALSSTPLGSRPSAALPETHPHPPTRANPQVRGGGARQARKAQGPGCAARVRSTGGADSPNPGPAPHCSQSDSLLRTRAQARLWRSRRAPGGPRSWVGDGRIREDVLGGFSAYPRGPARAGAPRPPRETVETPAAAATPVT